MKHGGREDDSFCSAGAYIAYRIGTYPCIPYVYNLSQDVEKCTLDLVISSCTRTITIQGIALASKQCPKFLQDGLLVRVPARCDLRRGLASNIGLGRNLALGC